MGWVLKFKTKLKRTDRFLVEQLTTGLIILGAFFVASSYLGLIDHDEIITFPLLTLLIATLGFFIMHTRGVSFFHSWQEKTSGENSKLRKYIKSAELRDVMVDKIQNLNLDSCFKEGPDPEKQEILKTIASAVFAEKVSLFLPRDNSLFRVACWGIEPMGLEGLRIPFDQKSAMVKTFKSGRIIISSNVSSDPRFNKKLAHLTGAKQVVCIPLVAEGEIFGVLAVTNKFKGSFKNDDIMHLKSIAFSFASRLKQLDLEKKVNQRIEEEYKFLTEVAHQIKTPLTAARGEIELALKEKSENQIKKAMIFALECLEKSSKAIQEALNLSYLKVSKENDERIDLQNILQEACEIAYVMAEQKGITINLNGKNRLFTTGDRNKILQVVMNIIDNAINYTQKGGQISISLKKKNNMASLAIKDTGIGIPKKDIEHVFDRFWRGKNNGNKEGSGLGLSIAKSIIEMHKGTINLTSKVKQGTKVEVYLPLAS